MRKLVKNIVSGALVLALAFAPVSTLVKADGPASNTDATSSDASISDALKDVKIRSGVTVDGLDLGDKTYEEALALLSSQTESNKSQSVTMASSYGDVSATLGDLGLKENTVQAAKKAVEYGNSGNLIKRYNEEKVLSTKTVNIPLKRTVNQQSISSVIDKAIGDKLNSSDDYVLSKNDDGSVKVAYNGESQGVDCYAVCQMLEKTLNDQWDKGAVSFDISSAKGGETERVKQLSEIHDLLGHYSTDYNQYIERATNVQRAADLLNGHVLYPGESLSVYDSISPITLENGYGMGHAYVGTKTVDSVGGGVCQVATTLYNALLRAEIEILQRDCHGLPVSYVPISADAAIAGGWCDLIFKNNLDSPIYIEAYYGGGTLTFNVYGKEYRPSNRTVEYESVQTSTIPIPDEPEITEDLTLEPGQEVVTDSGSTGATGELWKYVYVDGELQEKTRVNTSSYRAVPKQISKNLNEPEEKPEEQPSEAPTEAPTEAPAPQPAPEPQTTEAPTEAPTEATTAPAPTDSANPQ